MNFYFLWDMTQEIYQTWKNIYHYVDTTTHLEKGMGWGNDNKKWQHVASKTRLYNWSGRGMKLSKWLKCLQDNTCDSMKVVVYRRKPIRTKYLTLTCLIKCYLIHFLRAVWKVGVYKSLFCCCCHFSRDYVHDVLDNLWSNGSVCCCLQ